MERTYLAMKVAEKASAERGPANVVLGDTQPPDPAKRGGWRSSAASPTSPSWTCCRPLQASTMPTAHPPARSWSAPASSWRPPARSWTAWPALPLAGTQPRHHQSHAAGRGGHVAVIDTPARPRHHAVCQREAVYPELAMPWWAPAYAAELREYAGRLACSLRRRWRRRRR